jgi:hypothetical protein
MYPKNKYLFETIFEKNNELYQDFMISVNDEYTEIINTLKSENTISEIRKLIHKLLNVVINLVDKNYEMIYYCNLVLLINKTDTDITKYSVYIKMIVDYNKELMGLLSTTF